MNFTASRVATALFLGGLTATGALAQSAFSKALPANTIGFVSFPDITKSLQEMESAPLARMWHEGEVQDFVADAMQMMESEWDQMMAEGKKAFEAGHIPFDPSEMTKLRLHSLNIALTGLELGEFEGEPFPNIGIVAQANLGESAPIWRKALTTLLNQAVDQSRGEAALTNSKIGEADLMVLGPAEMPDFPLSLNIAFAGEDMVIGTRREEVASFLKSWGSGQSHLAASNEYLACANHLRVDGAAAEVYFRPGAILDFAIDALRTAQQYEDDLNMVDVDGVERVINALGLRSVLSTGGTSRYDNGRCVTNSYIACPKAQRRGLMANLSGEIDMSRLRWVPKDAASMSMGVFDVSSVYPTLVQALRAYDPKFAEDMLGRLADAEKQVGISLENDIFGAFGNKYVSWQLPMASFAAAPEMATIVEVKNKDGLVKALRKVAELSQGRIEIEENERRGIKVYQIVINLDDFAGGGGFNPLASFTPTFAFKDDNLVVAFTTGDIKRAFKRMDRDDDPAGDIRSNSEFAPYLQKLPQGGVQSLSFRDWKAEFESLYQIGTTVLAFVPLDDEIPVDLSLLPDSSTLTQHLFGEITWTRVNDDGFMSTNIGPWGPETMALMVGAIGAGAAVFGMMEARGGF